MSKTRAEFEAEYNDGKLRDLLLYGRLSIECRCEWDQCSGWKMTQLDRLSDDIKFQHNTPDEVQEAIDHRLTLVDQFKLEPKGSE